MTRVRRVMNARHKGLDVVRVRSLANEVDLSHFGCEDIRSRLWGEMGSRRKLGGDSQFGRGYDFLRVGTAAGGPGGRATGGVFDYSQKRGVSSLPVQRRFNLKGEWSWIRPERRNETMWNWMRAELEDENSGTGLGVLGWLAWMKNSDNEYREADRAIEHAENALRTSNGCPPGREKVRID